MGRNTLVVAAVAAMTLGSLSACQPGAVPGRGCGPEGDFGIGRGDDGASTYRCIGGRWQWSMTTEHAAELLKQAQHAADTADTATGAVTAAAGPAATAAADPAATPPAAPEPLGAPPAPACPALGPPTTTGRIADGAVIESSGLASGIRSPGVLFTQNDSGDGPRVFAMGIDGRPLGRYELSTAQAADWEDLGIGPGPGWGVSYLYVGDIGGPRTRVSVYRVPEPQVATATATTADTTLGEVTRFDLAYPGGASYDAETLLVDPLSDDINIVTKSRSGISEVFRFTPGVNGGAVPLVHVATLAVPGPGNLEATGGSVSSDGSMVAIRTYDRLLRWRRPAGSTIAAALAAPPCVDRLAPQPQGEAVAFGPGGHTLLVTSEGPSSAIGSYTFP